MKRLLVSAFMAAVLMSGNVSADETVPAASAKFASVTAPVSNAFSGIATRGSNLKNRISTLIPSINLTSKKQWAANNRWFVGGSVTLVAGVALMYKTCPWFRKLIGCEDTATTKKRVLDPRVTDSRY